MSKPDFKEGFEFATCMGCHVIGTGENHGVGPDLRGVVGKRIASEEDFTYSNGLQARGRMQRREAG